MVASFDLTDLDRVERMITATYGPSTQQDAFFGDLIAEVSSEAQRILGRDVESSSKTEVYDAHPNMHRLELRSWPATSITEIRVHVDGDFASVTALNVNAYRLIQEDGMVLFDYPPLGVRRGFVAPRSIQVQYTGGMAADQSTFFTSFPDITAAVTRQVVHLWKRRDTPGAQSNQYQGAGVSRPLNVMGETGYLKEFVRTLEQYARVPVGG